jgi:hypothetical protein
MVSLRLTEQRGEREKRHRADFRRRKTTASPVMAYSVHKNENHNENIIRSLTPQPCFLSGAGNALAVYFYDAF